MSGTTVRIHLLGDGVARDTELQFGLDRFAGHLPAIGDEILVPGTATRDRRFWRVKRRIFSPRDVADYVVLVVEEGTATAEDAPLIG